MRKFIHGEPALPLTWTAIASVPVVLVLGWLKPAARSVYNKHGTAPHRPDVQNGFVAAERAMTQPSASSIRRTLCSAPRRGMPCSQPSPPL